MSEPSMSELEEWMERSGETKCLNLHGDDCLMEAWNAALRYRTALDEATVERIAQQLHAWHAGYADIHQWAGLSESSRDWWRRERAVPIIRAAIEGAASSQPAEGGDASCTSEANPLGKQRDAPASDAAELDIPHGTGAVGRTGQHEDDPAAQKSREIVEDATIHRCKECGTLWRRRENAAAQECTDAPRRSR